MKNEFFRMAVAVLVAAALAVTVGPAGAQSGGAGSAAAAVDDDPQSPPLPEGVAPADPSFESPCAPHWRCHHCGAMNAGPMWRQGGAAGRRVEGRVGGRTGVRERAYRDASGRDWTRGPGRGHGGGGIAAERMIRHATDLKLTDEQIDALEKLASDTKKTLVDLHAEIAKEEIEIQDLLRSGSDDLAAVRRHAGALSKARSAIFEERISNFFEARKLLTAEQKKIVKEEFPRLGTMLD